MLSIQISVLKHIAGKYENEWATDPEATYTDFAAYNEMEDCRGCRVRSVLSLKIADKKYIYIQQQTPIQYTNGALAVLYFMFGYLCVRVCVCIYILLGSVAFSSSSTSGPARRD